MRIRYRTLSAGPSGVRQADSVHDVPQPEAEALIHRGYAVAVDALPAAARVVPPVETADAPPVGETAALTPAGKPVGAKKPPKAGK